MKKKILLFVSLLFVVSVSAQDIPHHISYSRVYDFVDELATDGYIDVNTAVKPWSRSFIASKLVEAEQYEAKMNKRQRIELNFFLEEFAIERDTLPDFYFPLEINSRSQIDLAPPVYHYRDNRFRARIQPILGMHIYSNNGGQIYHRWFGADVQGMIGKHVSIFGSLRDNSFEGTNGLLPRLSNPTYLTQHAGYEYKEPNDYSDSRGGVMVSWDWGSIGLVKDNVMWGDNYNGSNILSGRAPSFPMITLRVKPTNWIELNYIHGWLVSNVVDSARYYIENGTQKWYRNHNKYIAANMITFTPIKGLSLSAGNSIIYAEDNVQPGYLLPIAFYKSIDHTLTKGIGTENQNSQLFINLSSRNVKHLHLYTSVFVDEIKFSRFKPSHPEANPISFKAGLHLSNYPFNNLSASVEYTRTNIINYKHSIDALTYASNSYVLGHYLGDNAQEIHASLTYKPIRGLDLKAYYTDAARGNEYVYNRRGVNGNIRQIISQPVLGDVIWRNKTAGLKAMYEVLQNAYAVVSLENSNIRAFDAQIDAIPGEVRMTPEETLDLFTPPFLHGNKTTLQIGFSFGF